MILLVLKERVLQNNDWITLLFMLCFVIICITRNSYANRFNDYLNLLFSDRYVTIYKDSSNLKSWFTIVLFIVQIISYTLFIHYLLFYFFNFPKSDYLFFIRLATGLTFFILAKFLIEKIIATIFDAEEFMEQFNLLKISYRTYMSLLLLPVSLILYYNSSPISPIIYSLLGILLFSHLIIYLNGLRALQKSIYNYLFYFILYLCTLEIAPYYFVYYIFTKKIAVLQ